MKSYRKALTIAGSDSGGGAGIQADLKTFSACGCYGMSAITAITAQNTCGVTAIHPVPPAVIAAQIRAVLDDIGTDAIKIGMLHSADVIMTVAQVLREYGCNNIVLDPVMVATSGDRLIEESAVATLLETLLPLATLITPNIPEAEILTKKKISTRDDMISAAQLLSSEYSLAVLLKGGHLKGTTLVDVYWPRDADSPIFFENERIATRNSHGTGCTLSSAIAAFIAHQESLHDAVRHAEKYLYQAISAGSEYSLGKGHGPVHHFFNFHKQLPKEKIS
ncbi:bifunctional hydroxymethylpyrimidine kinase/phosphomethylpyrimidine kinase [Desulfopila inferna]|uniref:bifunctional hydroxymethylpyrimidine kinase/phosphomethylpyrimidine kinase n=1 Tax=Desulfopila inferna TaxID=468528 RepID=UPI0019659779|nr:bifunctional hydroxymethylpyrimidine kinase/phosphomethylpyrimidine kinase [Desulfopila inferna]MBM9604942.1 bifunctional hydroxymethylpyrimidine kinase/phosphomethylpyrimidine kinase [Desulfopila inferna]